MIDLKDQSPQEAQGGTALVKQRALNALTFLLAAAVMGEAYLLWEMNDRVDLVMDKLAQIERNGTAADWKVIPNSDHAADVPDSQTDSAGAVDPLGYSAPLFWDPFSDLDRARREMNQLMQQMQSDSVVYAPRSERLIRKTAPSQRLRVEDVGDSYVASLKLPGVDEADATVSVADNTLTIIVKHSEREGAQTVSGQSSRISGQSVWRMALSEAVEESEMKSCLKDGVLTVTIPKR